MKRERPSRGIRRPLASDHLHGSARFGRCATWAGVDRQLEVRARIVVTLDALETGDIELAVDVLFQLLDDLDAVEAILGRAA